MSQAITNKVISDQIIVNWAIENIISIISKVNLKKIRIIDWLIKKLFT